MSNTSSLWGKYGKTQKDMEALDRIVKKQKQRRKRERQNRKKGRREKK